MTIERYKKNINLHAATTLCVGVISLVFSILTQIFGFFSSPVGNLKTQITLAFVAIGLAVFQFFYTRNILKKRLSSLANLETIEQKVSRYYSLMLQSLYISAFTLSAIAAVSIFVENSLLVCLEALVFVFSFMLLKPSAYRIKMDIQLSESDVARIYGENWNK